MDWFGIELMVLLAIISREQQYATLQQVVLQ